MIIVKIKEQDSEHLIIVATLGERIGGVIFLIMASILLSYYFLIFSRSDFGFFTVIPFIVIPLVFIYWGMRMLISKRFFFNKSLNNIIVEKPSLLLIREKHILSFADIENVDIMYSRTYNATEGWRVSLNTGGKSIEVDHGTSKDKMYNLADEISKFTGTLLADNSAKPDSILRRMFQ